VQLLLELWQPSLQRRRLGAQTPRLAEERGTALPALVMCFPRRCDIKRFGL
jgi:hypothetical protein